MSAYTAVLSENGVRFAEKLSRDFDIVLLPSENELSREVASHADMTTLVFGDSLFVPKQHLKRNAPLFEALAKRTAHRLVADETPRGEKYPNDIALNILICDSFAFSLAKYTSPAAAEELKLRGMTHVSIKQGYAACSSLSFGTSIVSADRGVIRAATSCGLDCLEISSGNITLEGLSEGFVGGASGVCEDKIYFLGNIERHPDGAKIVRFAYERGFECVSLSSSVLSDLGGIKFIPNAQLIPRQEAPYTCR